MQSLYRYSKLWVTARQITRIHLPRIGPRMQIWENSKLSKAIVPFFLPKQCLYQKVAVEMENPKMQSLYRCNKRSAVYRPANNQDSFTTYRAEIANLGKFEAVEKNGTAFVPKQCSYQKVALAMETPKMQSLSRCNKRTFVLRPRVQIWENSKLLKTMVPPLHQNF